MSRAAGDGGRTAERFGAGDAGARAAVTAHYRPRRVGDDPGRPAARCGGALVDRAAPPPRQTAPASSPITLPFIVEGQPSGFASLAEAVAAADDGAVVTVHGPGPYPTPPLSLRGRSLTLRAAAGDRPCLEMTAAAADPWQAMLETDRDLTLEGLDLRAPAGAGGRLICGERAALRLSDCRLYAPTGAGVVHRNGGELTLQSCRVETGGTAVSVEAGEQPTCRVRLVGTTLEASDPSAAALACGRREVRQLTAVDVELTGDTITAARTTALTALPVSMRITARDSEFFFRDALLSCAGYADREGWQATTTWDGRDEPLSRLRCVAECKRRRDGRAGPGGVAHDVGRRGRLAGGAGLPAGPLGLAVGPAPPAGRRPSGAAARRRRPIRVRSCSAGMHFPFRHGFLPILRRWSGGFFHALPARPYYWAGTTPAHGRALGSLLSPKGETHARPRAGSANGELSHGCGTAGSEPQTDGKPVMGKKPDLVHAVYHNGTDQEARIDRQVAENSILALVVVDLSGKRMPTLPPPVPLAERQEIAIPPGKD